MQYLRLLTSQTPSIETSLIDYREVTHQHITCSPLTCYLYNWSFLDLLLSIDHCSSNVTGIESPVLRHSVVILLLLTSIILRHPPIHLLLLNLNPLQNCDIPKYPKRLHICSAINLQRVKNRIKCVEVLRFTKAILNMDTAFKFKPINAYC